ELCKPRQPEQKPEGAKTVRFEKKRLDQMQPADYNPRKHLEPGDAEWGKLEASIDTFGMVEPILWNEQTGNIVGGHQRYSVLQAKGVEETDVVVLNIDPEEEKILNVALNKISGRWDTEKLIDVLEELKAAGSMEITGFDDWELDALKVTYDHIEDLLQEGFSDTGGAELGSYTMTLTLPANVKETLDAYTAAHPAAKTEFATLIANKARGIM
ncbi:MAG: ParB N-terminal domain-containing protein, partial [Oscillospiraceae bacterium]